MRKINSLIIFLLAVMTLFFIYFKKEEKALTIGNEVISSTMTTLNNIENRSLLPTQAPTPKYSPDVYKEVLDMATKGNEEDYAALDNEGRALIDHVFVDGDKVIAHGDIILGEYQKLKPLLDKGEAISLEVPRKWSERIPYEIDSGISNLSEVKKAIAEFNGLGFIQFYARRKDDKDYLFFSRGEEHCYSYLGKQGGKQPIWLSDGCGTQEILHEMMHALGFLHEQNRVDRDQYIWIHWYNIASEHHLQFKILPQLYSIVLNTAFDFESIMLYGVYDFSTSRDDYSITKRDGTPYERSSVGLSRGDKLRLKELFNPDR